MAHTLKALLLADTHLGFDLPFKPRIERRRRGYDFFANFKRALEPALSGKVDIVIHGGDLLYRSKVPASLVEMAMAPLVRVAEHGVPVFVVPGNHERSKIPLHLWGTHRNLKIFDQPRTYAVNWRGKTIALAGFPFQRNIRDRFRTQVARTGFDKLDADLRLLCIHETVEGAQVGPSDYTFRRGPEVIPGRFIPGDFGAILCGHIHRSQVLTHDLSGRKMASPVIYPGSIERTSFAERNEEKHYVVLKFAFDESSAGHLIDISFAELPTRPMVSMDLSPETFTREELEAHLKGELSKIDPDSIVRFKIRGALTDETAQVLSTPALRQIAPSTMNVSIGHTQRRDRKDPRARHR